MNFMKKNLLILVLMFSLFVVPVFSSAQVAGRLEDPQVKIINPINTKDLNGFVKNLLEGVIRIGIPLIALAIIYCGFLFVSARGNSEKITAAKDALMYTLIGAALLLGSWAIAQLISETVLAL